MRYRYGMQLTVYSVRGTGKKRRTQQRMTVKMLTHSKSIRTLIVKRRSESR